jgi:hypothetical protein
LVRESKGGRIERVLRLHLIQINGDAPSVLYHWCRRRP